MSETTTIETSRVCEVCDRRFKITKQGRLARHGFTLWRNGNHEAGCGNLVGQIRRYEERVGECRINAEVAQGRGDFLDARQSTRNAALYLRAAAELRAKAATRGISLVRADGYSARTPEENEAEGRASRTYWQRIGPYMADGSFATRSEAR